MHETFVKKKFRAYILHFELGEEAKYSSGIIKEIKKAADIKNVIIGYTCPTERGSSGGPIINPKNNKVFGIHIGYNKNKKLNEGLLIEASIEEFKNYYKRTSNSIRTFQFNRNYGRNNLEEENNNYEQKKKEEIKIHEHQIDLEDPINELCCNCSQKMENVPGYKCNFCNIILCLDCRYKIFYGNKNKNIHNHHLKLKYKNNNWTCKICGFEYGYDSYKCISFFCEQCNFDICDFCYLAQKDESEKQNNYNNSNMIEKENDLSVKQNNFNNNNIYNNI